MRAAARWLADQLRRQHAGQRLNEPFDGGLTSFGKRAGRRMNQLGLAIDLSHSSDKTALGTCAASDVPVLITHAGARTV